MRLYIDGAAGDSSAVFYFGRFSFKKLFSLRYFNNFYSVPWDVNTSERGMFRAVRGVWAGPFFALKLTLWMCNLELFYRAKTVLFLISVSKRMPTYAPLVHATAILPWEIFMVCLHPVLVCSLNKEGHWPRLKDRAVQSCLFCLKCLILGLLLRWDGEKSDAHKLGFCWISVLSARDFFFFFSTSADLMRAAGAWSRSRSRRPGVVCARECCCAAVQPGRFPHGAEEVFGKLVNLIFSFTRVYLLDFF